MIIRLGRAHIGGCSSKAEILVSHFSKASLKLAHVNLIARELIHRPPLHRRAAGRSSALQRQMVSGEALAPAFSFAMRSGVDIRQTRSRDLGCAWVAAFAVVFRVLQG
jgi:hypothetical protein